MGDKATVENNLPKVTQGQSDNSGMWPQVLITLNLMLLIFRWNYFVFYLFPDAAIICKTETLKKATKGYFYLVFKKVSAIERFITEHKHSCLVALGTVVLGTLSLHGEVCQSHLLKPQWYYQCETPKYL